jgi:hypothetical protein
MNYVNTDISKNNITADIADSIASVIGRILLVLKKSTTVLAKKAPTVITEPADYYAKSPKRSTHAVSIERELKAQGNLW